MVTKATILRAARDVIAERRESYICYAIGDLKIGTKRQKEQLTTWIMALLDGYVTYGHWLNMTYSEIKDPRGRMLYEGRLAWLDWMIEQVGEEV